MNLTAKIAAAALAASVTLAVAEPAHAETLTPVSLSCVTGGTRVTLTFDYSHNGYAVRYFNLAWTTSPATKLDRIQLAQNPWAGNESFRTWWRKGGSPKTRNDVPKSGGKAGFANQVQSGNDTPDPQVRFTAWGGKGDTSDSCRKTRTLPQ